MWSTNLQQRNQEYIMEEITVSQQILLGKLDSHMQNNKTRSLF